MWVGSMVREIEKREKHFEHQNLATKSKTELWKLQVLSGAKPAEKKRFINELQKDQNIVAMVGDGINDAAALASSHIGVAMGGGVGAASEVSSVVLMGNKLSQVFLKLDYWNLIFELKSNCQACRSWYTSFLAIQLASTYSFLDLNSSTIMPRHYINTESE